MIDKDTAEVIRRGMRRSSVLILAHVTAVLSDPNQYEGRSVDTGGTVRFAGPVGTTLSVGQPVMLARGDIAGRLLNSGYVFIGLSAVHARNATTVADPVTTTETVTAEVVTSMPDYVELTAGGAAVEVIIYGVNLSTAPTYGDAELDDASAQVITSTQITLSVEASSACVAGEYSLTVAGRTYPRFFRVAAAEAVESMWVWSGSNLLEVNRSTGATIQTFTPTGTAAGLVADGANIIAVTDTHIDAIIGGTPNEYALTGINAGNGVVAAGTRLVYTRAYAGTTAVALQARVCDMDATDGVTVTISATTSRYRGVQCAWDGTLVWGVSSLQNVSYCKLWSLNPTTSAVTVSADIELTARGIAVDSTYIYLLGEGGPTGIFKGVKKYAKADYSLVSSLDFWSTIGDITVGIAYLDGTTLYFATEGASSGLDLVVIDTTDMSYTVVALHATDVMSGGITCDATSVYVAGGSGFYAINKTTHAVTSISSASSIFRMLIP